MSQKKPFRVVQVGCGGRGQAWINDTMKLPEDYEYVGMVDLNRKAAEDSAAKRDLPASIVYDTLEQALSKAKPDVVFDVTVPAVHHEVVIPAFEAGCDVLGEKPMSDRLDVAKTMVESARKHGKIYAVTQTQRNTPNIQTFADFLQGGALGPIEEVHLDFFIGAHFGGFRDEMEDVLLADMSIHHFDAIRKVTGADPVAVYCHSFNPGRSWYRGDANAIAIFEMSNGIRVSYRGSWCAEGLNTRWHCDWRVWCRNGAASWDGAEAYQAERVKDGAEGFIRETEAVEVPRAEDKPANQMGYLIEFARCLREGTKPETDCTDNIKSLAMVMAAIESARSGRRVEVVA